MRRLQIWSSKVPFIHTGANAVQQRKNGFCNKKDGYTLRTSFQAECADKIPMYEEQNPPELKLLC